MSELKVITEETKLKILKYAAVMLSEHGLMSGDRTCQNWSVDEEGIEAPDTGFTDNEKKDISFNYEQWNSNGEDYDPDCMFFHDEMSVSFMLSRAIELIVKELESKELHHDRNIMLQMRARKGCHPLTLSSTVKDDKCDCYETVGVLSSSEWIVSPNGKHSVVGITPSTEIKDASVKDLYMDLLYCVESKCGNETRHETAKRLIINAQQSIEGCDNE